MDTLSYKTKFANANNFTRNWYVIDAEGEVLGRLASKIANVIRGKYKADFTPHFNSGDKVVVINADKIRLTGKKWEQKIYTRHTGYPGGLYETNFKKMHARFPGRPLEKAVKGMLPKGPLGYAMIKKLKMKFKVKYNITLTHCIIEL